MSIPADLSKYTSTHDITLSSHSHGISESPLTHTHSLSANIKEQKQMNELFMVEFLFESTDSDSDFTEIRNLGIFTDENLADSVAFEYAEAHIDDEEMTALYITKFIPNETGTEETVVEHYFGEEETFVEEA